MYQAAPAEAADLFLKVTAFIDACDQSINEADALITNNGTAVSKKPELPPAND